MLNGKELLEFVRCRWPNDEVLLDIVRCCGPCWPNAKVLLEFVRCRWPNANVFLEFVRCRWPNGEVLLEFALDAVDRVGLMVGCC